MKWNEVKSVELVASRKYGWQLITYNESKNIINIETGPFKELDKKFNQTHQQIIKETEQSYFDGIVITENNRKKVRKNLFKKRSDGTYYQIEYNKPNTSEWILLPSAVYCVVGNKYRLTKVKQ